MMTSDFFVDRLKAWGVKRIYGYSGDGINGVLGALQRAEKAGDGIEFIQVRHEEMAAFMATAHAKMTGELGVCLSTGGPGATHLITGVYDAKLDHVPVLAIAGQAEATVRGADYQQELNLDRMFADVADYVQEAGTVAQVRHIADRAIRVAIAENGVGVIILPKDIQDSPWEEPQQAHGFTRSGPGYSKPITVPYPADLQRAAELLNAGSKVAILIGAGARGAADEIKQAAELLGAGVAKALLGKTVLPDALPYVTGSIGLLGTKPSWDMMNGCDTLLMVGTTFPYAEFLPKDGQARAVQVDINPNNVSMRYATEVNLIGDSAEVLQRLLPYLEEKTDPGWRERIELNVRKWWRALESAADEPAQPINPQKIFWELSKMLPNDVILCGDCGSHTNWYARDLKMREGMMASLSGKLATMGGGVPYAIAAKMAHPNRPVLAVVGDGAMQMNGNAELVTVKQYWQRWANPSFIVMVLANRDLNQVTWEQRALAGDPKFSAAQDVEDFSYAAYARLLGFEGIRVDAPEDIANAWMAAFAARRPVVIEFAADPDVPPLPPHITLAQAKAYAMAMMRGDTDRAGVIRQTLREVLS